MIRDLPLADLVRATGLTHGYLSQVRRGLKTPHPRHWPALRYAGSPEVVRRPGPEAWEPGRLAREMPVLAPDPVVF